MPDNVELLRRVYALFNGRDITLRNPRRGLRHRRA
jgi:hypothetical protein